MPTLAFQWASLQLRGLLERFPGAATIKWLAPTHQPNIKLVMGLSSKASKQYLLSASAIRLHSFNRPASANANPGLSMGQFAIAWATWKISRRSHYKMAGPNPSTQHEFGDWIEFQGFQAMLAVSICHPVQRCSRYKMAGLNPSTQHKIGGWIEFQGFQAILAVGICHPLHSFNRPASANANPGLSMGQFAIAWATWKISRRSHYKMAGPNPSTQHEIGDGIEFQGFQAILAVSICHPFAFF